MAASAPPSKPVHTIVLDAGPILKNTPPLSTLLAQSEELVTTPSVINEIRDPDARSRVETLYLPFVKQRSPAPKSVAVLSEFARKTGDRTVLSKTDIEVLALAYEVECERNGGDWRLRSVPGQRQVNGKPPVKEEDKKDETQSVQTDDKVGTAEVDKIAEDLKTTTLENGAAAQSKEETAATSETAVATETTDTDASTSQQPQENEDESDSDSGGWITPSNLKKRQARDEAVSSSSAPEPKTMQVATMTTDFAVCSDICIVIGPCANYSTVPKCPSSDEPKPPISCHPAANPTSQVFHKALPCLFLYYKRHDQAILPALRKRYPYSRVMHYRS